VAESTADERRNEILRASRRIFTEKGYVKALTKEIAAAAGISESSLFSIFGSKEEIFVAAMFDPLDDLVLEMLDISAVVPAREARDRQRAYVRANERMLQVMSEVVFLIGIAMFSDRLLGQRYFDERLGPLFRRWLEATEQTLRNEAGVDIPPRLLLMSVFGSHFGLSLDAAMRGVEIDNPHCARWLAKTYWSGIGSLAR
jgi:AcrR family transcriptional regulator